MRRMSLLSAFKGETYSTTVLPEGQAAVTSWLIAQRKAQRVLPLPVGAVRRTCAPEAMTGQELS